MMVRIWWVVAVVVGLLGFGPTAHARDDWNLWHDEILRLLKRGGYSLSLWQTTRYRDDFSEPYFVMGKVINRYELHSNLGISVDYAYIQMKDSANHWVEEHRPDVALYPTLRLGTVTIENRMMLELRAIEGAAGEEDWRYRNQLKATVPIPKTDGTLKLYASEEPFYSTPPDQWNQNRVFLGLSYAPRAWLSTSVSWGIQSIRHGGDWEDRQILSLSAKVSF